MWTHGCTNSVSWETKCWASNKCTSPTLSLLTQIRLPRLGTCGQILSKCLTFKATLIFHWSHPTCSRNLHSFTNILFFRLINKNIKSVLVVLSGSHLSYLLNMIKKSIWSIECFEMTSQRRVENTFLHHYKVNSNSNRKNALRECKPPPMQLISLQRILE